MIGDVTALALLAPMLLLVGLVDGRTGRIPDALNAGIAGLGLLRLAMGSPETLLAHGLDAAIVGGLLLLLRRLYRVWRGRTGLGLGDVKFLVAATLWTGLEALPLVVLLASLSGLAMVGLQALRGGAIRADRRLRFGPHLALALMAVLLLDRFTG
ncbi:prepilin peptidase [Aureimonas ureilytica]|uniref:prepilin peptidase n=1 Tax=Aureimonas ureilytica TaxID=401562 RepID=UPI00036710C0|nr:A24 family peptidase [Aureimonas ureilytica]